MNTVIENKKILSVMIIFVLIGSFGSSFASRAMAQTADDSGVPKQYTLLEPLPCVGPDQSKCSDGYVKSVDIKYYMVYVFNLVLALAIILAVAVIVFYGFVYMTSEVMGNKSEARARIEAAVLGLIAALSTFLILKTINPQLVDLSKTIPNLKLTATKQIQLDALDRGLERLNVNSAERQAITQSYKNASDLSSKAAALKATITDSMTEEQVLAILNQVAQIEQNASAAKTVAIIQSRKLNSDIDYQIIQEALAKGDTETATNYLKVLDNRLNNTLTDPNVANNPLAVQQIKDQKTYYDSLTYIDKLTSYVGSKGAAYQAISAVSDQLSANLSKIQDPELKKQYSDAAKSRVDTLVTKFNLPDTYRLK